MGSWSSGMIIALGARGRFPLDPNFCCTLRALKIEIINIKFFIIIFIKMIKRYLSEEELKIWNNQNISNEIEDSNIKAECIIWDDIEDMYKYKNISDLEGYMKVKKINSYNFGDLVSFSTYRDTGTMFIGKNGNLINKKDYTNAGYLTIPYEITQYLKNATHKYKDIEYNYIDLRHDDVLLETKIGKNLNSEFKYFYDPYEDKIWVDYPNKSQGEFDLNSTNKQDIESFYEGSKKEQSKVKLFFELKNNDYIKFKDKYGSTSELPKIPKTWQVYCEGGGGGSNHTYSNIYFNGPTETLAEVIEKINMFYEGFNYKITV